MRNPNGFNRRRDDQEKTKRKKSPNLDQLLNRKPFTEMDDLYQINPKSGRLYPSRLPRSKGDKIVIKKGLCPKQFETNIICDDVHYIGDHEIKTWVPRFDFYVGQVVSFWQKDTQSDYQIQPSGDSRYGIFVLINKKDVIGQPGGSYRTSKSKSV